MVSDMKIVIATDSFKGSLSGLTINSIWEKVAAKSGCKHKIVPLLVADGGDGTLDAVISQKFGQLVYVPVNNPLFEKIDARYGVFDDCALISMCECSGLTLIPRELRNPLKTTSFGTGELIKHAVLSGKKKIYVALGGSATNDAGIGALTALGFKFIKRDGSFACGVGGELADIVKIDQSDAIDLSGVEIIVLSDVTNPLTGKNGATNVFARQKGASDQEIELLERGMLNFKNVFIDTYGVDADKIAGAGAAGGMGSGLAVMLNAKIVSGVEKILDIVNFDEAISGADYIITGEGKIDAQSVDGKVISGILKHAKAAYKPVIAVVGTVGEGYERLFEMGLTAVFSIIDGPNSFEDIIKKSPMLYERTAQSILRLLDNEKMLKGTRKVIKNGSNSR